MRPRSVLTASCVCVCVFCLGTHDAAYSASTACVCIASPTGPAQWVGGACRRKKLCIVTRLSRIVQSTLYGAIAYRTIFYQRMNILLLCVVLARGMLIFCSFCKAFMVNVSVFLRLNII